MRAEEQIDKAKAEQQAIKCVVWDLDHTLWDGVLLEDDDVSLRNGVVEVIRELDRRGILNSIASKNDPDAAMSKMAELGIGEYFLYPAITWNPKSISIRSIASSLNLGLDTFAFVDDQDFEREEVAYELPEVLCIDAAHMGELLEMPRMNPRFITSESSLRRRLYLSDLERRRAEDSFTGTSETFLATLDMDFRIRIAEESDLQRAEELTVRTHQLNTTGYTYSYDELAAFRHSKEHVLLVATLTDKFGAYGTIGLALVECGARFWTLKLLLMSCRVLSRGVGNIMMGYIMNRAKTAGVPLRAEFIPNGRNRMMLVTYRFGGFKEIDHDGDLKILENPLTSIPPYPDYLKIRFPD